MLYGVRRRLSVQHGLKASRPLWVYPRLLGIGIHEPHDGRDSEEVASTYSGSCRDKGGFSVRLIWRTGGAGEMYTYLPRSFSANLAQCRVPPFSTSNPTYGTSVGRGSFFFQPGDWTSVVQRMRLNDAGQENGELEVIVNGQSKINVSGLVLRSSEAGRIRGMQIQTFFGGSFSLPYVARN